jgi:DNA integrity scanning protein DisA with diadenylate cyclase activity
MARGVPILFCDTEEELCYTIQSWFDKCLKYKEPTRFNTIVKDSINPVVNFLSSIPHINTKTAELIVENTGVKTLNELLTLNPTTLSTIKGIGKKKIEIIMEGLL